MTTIVSLHAHPDDEALLTGGWLAQRAAAGDRVVIIFATDGNAELASTDSRCVATLGHRRRAEASESARALGVARVRWLGHADSGMAGSPSALPDRFVHVPLERAARAVAAVLDEEDADVLTGYDANGGYGHPDHVHVHRVARRAQQLAARRPRLLEATMDRTWLVRLLRVVRPFRGLLPGVSIPGDDIFTEPSALLMRIDVRDDLDAKLAALAAHHTQATGGVRTIRLLLALPRPLARQVLGTEWFTEVRHD
ncbi:PIG-L family deacetylase [Nocardioides cavernae]|uniref:PIG-L deacetylase family protein n=1 Tax=Nocardioides TaxID=1839 RepID=UPI0009EC20D9|nr:MULTISPECIES: PIG-L family deacetylase [Nocardioides]MCK9824441.1 PIG-L family deacetylase [Nocardioides cavernae]